MMKISTLSTVLMTLMIALPALAQPKPTPEDTAKQVIADRDAKDREIDPQVLSSVMEQGLVAASGDMIKLKAQGLTLFDRLKATETALDACTENAAKKSAK